MKLSDLGQTKAVLGFLRRAAHTRIYPVVFNEPVNWIADQDVAVRLSALRWSQPAIYQGIMAVYRAAIAVEGEPHGLRLQVSERIVEIPFVHRALMRAGVEPPARILEFGCAASRLALELATLGYQVTGVDLQPYGISHPNLTFLQGNILTLALNTAAFDAITAVSVVEHLGLEIEAGYGVPAPGEDDVAVLGRLGELLGADGVLILSVPFGKAGQGKGYRVYDADACKRVTAGWAIEDEQYFVRLDGAWVGCEERELRNISSIEIDSPFPVNGVVLLVLRKGK